MIPLKNQDNIANSESLTSSPKRYTRRNFIALGMLGTFGLTGGYFCIDTLFKEEGAKKNRH